MNKKIAYICHPWRGSNGDKTLTKAICFHLATKSDIIPMSTGILFNSFLDDNDSIQRRVGIEAGLEVMKKCDVIYAYTKHGISDGMKEELAKAEELNIPIEKFPLYPWD